MAYTIKFNLLGEDVVRSIRDSLFEHIKADNRFTAKLNDVQYDCGSYRRSAGGFFTVKPVRLIRMKPYCGAHPGECVVNPYAAPEKKRNSRCLEWNDWVAFHDLVNDFVDLGGYDADIWTTPMEQLDHGKKMWVRKNGLRRTQWDYEERYVGNHWAPQRIWNTGSADQFAR